MTIIKMLKQICEKWLTFFLKKMWTRKPIWVLKEKNNLKSKQTASHVPSACMYQEPVTSSYIFNCDTRWEDKDW